MWNISNSDTDPIVVVVANGRYDIFGDATSPRAVALAALLQRMGGVADHTADGTYHFNAEMIDGELAYASLEQIEE